MKWQKCDWWPGWGIIMNTMNIINGPSDCNDHHFHDQECVGSWSTLAPGAGDSVKTWSQTWPLNFPPTKISRISLCMKYNTSGTRRTNFLIFCWQFAWTWSGYMYHKSKQDTLRTPALYLCSTKKGGQFKFNILLSDFCQGLNLFWAQTHFSFRIYQAFLVKKSR